MGTVEKPVQLKVYIDQKKKKVMFAEAEEDFVDILCGFFILPLGTIARLSKEHLDLNDIRVGSLNSLYEIVVNLNVKHFSEKYYKDILVEQKNLLLSLWPKLKINPDEKKPTIPIFGRDAVFVKNKTNFIITDDLNVVPVKLDTGILLLNSLGVENINLLEKRTMSFGFHEFMNLLLWSLLTINPLTNLVLGGSKPSSSCITNSTLNYSAFNSRNSGQTLTAKLVLQKSKKKLLCAQVENLFVELLLSFLAIPLGAFLRLTKDDLSPLGITNLYNSISCLGDGNYLKEGAKNTLLFPEVSDTHPCVTDLLPIYGVKSRGTRYLKEPATFLVSDNLEISASSMDTISMFNTLGVPVGDMEVLDVSIGVKEGGGIIYNHPCTLLKFGFN